MAQAFQPVQPDLFQITEVISIVQMPDGIHIAPTHHDAAGIYHRIMLVHTVSLGCAAAPAAFISFAPQHDNGQSVSGHIASHKTQQIQISRLGMNGHTGFRQQPGPRPRVLYLAGSTRLFCWKLPTPSGWRVGLLSEGANWGPDPGLFFCLFVAQRPIHCASVKPASISSQPVT